MSEEHETFIKTPKQLIIAIVLAFVIPIALIALLVSYVGQTSRVGAGAGAMDEQSVTDRIRPVSTYELAGAAGPAKVHSGEEVYAGQCAACHAAGVAGAPKLGDTAQWAERLKTGLETLVNSALKGKGAMAAQAGGQYSDLEIAKAVVHMANSAGGDFEEPTEESMSGSQADTAPAEKKTESSVNGGQSAAESAPKTSSNGESGAQPADQQAQGGSAAPSSATPSIVSRARQAGTSVAVQAADKAGQAARIATEASASARTTDGQSTGTQGADQAAGNADATTRDNVQNSAASAADRVAAASNAASAVNASVASEPAVPTTADKLVFTDASEVTPASGAGIPKRLSIFFDSGSSNVSDAAADDLWNLIYFTKSGDWSRIGLSGFTDGTGNKEINERLSRKRMSNVRDILIDIGVAEDRIVMIKPERVEAASGASKNARRVEVFHSR